MSGKEKIKARINADEDTGTPKQNASPQTGENRTDYDSAWKEVIEKLFDPFTEFFFPDIHKDIDFSKGIEKGVKVISVAILTDEDENYRPSAPKIHRLAHPLAGRS